MIRPYNVDKRPSELRPHPINIEIYGLEVADTDMVDSVKSKGILEPIVIKEDNTILSGHRRWMASRDLKLDTVPCRVVSFDNGLDEIEALIDFNKQRDKSLTQRMKEKDKLEWVEREHAKERQKEHGHTAPGKPSDTPAQMGVSVPKGESRDKVAEKIGMSRGTMLRAEKVWDKVKSGDTKAAELIKQVDEKKITINKAFTEINKEIKKEEHKKEISEKLAALPAVQKDNLLLMYNKDFFQNYKDNHKESSIDCIITDPPYNIEWIDNWKSLSEAANYLLKPSGYLITYSGELNLPEVISSLGTHLNYYWICVLLHSGCNQLIHPRHIKTGWKPILIYQKSPKKKLEPIFDDVIIGTGKEKENHEWQQAVDELSSIITTFTNEGDIILDPCCGSGTTLIASSKYKRKAIGYEIDKDRYDELIVRVNSAVVDI
jgi:16S rRNA G966 N2-methylase RsmD